MANNELGRSEAQQRSDELWPWRNSEFFRWEQLRYLSFLEDKMLGKIG